MVYFAVCIDSCEILLTMCIHMKAMCFVTYIKQYNMLPVVNSNNREWRSRGIKAATGQSIDYIKFIYIRYTYPHKKPCSSFRSLFWSLCALPCARRVLLV